MGDDQRSNSRAILDQLFWAGIEPSSKRRVQFSAEDAPNERTTALLSQASPRPVELDRVFDTNNDVPPSDTAGQEATQVDSSAAGDRCEPKGNSSEPEPTQEIPSVSSPPVQPIPIEDTHVAHHAFQIELQEAPLIDAWIRCVAASTRPNNAASG